MALVVATAYRLRTEAMTFDERAEFDEFLHAEPAPAIPPVRRVS